jgi:hypothetical protein
MGYNYDENDKAMIGRLMSPGASPSPSSPHPPAPPTPPTAGAYHLLTIVHVFKPHLSCFKASLLPLKRPR